MERYLKNGTQIELKGIDGRYTIKNTIGRGASCIVYATEFFNANGEKTEHLLKEFNPRCIELYRDNGVLQTVKGEENQRFEELCKRFKAGVLKQADLRLLPELKNYTANIQNIYHDHGTVYVDMTVTAGDSYKDVNEKNVYELAQRMRTLAQAISEYHKHGYLHLDIKPENIFVRPEGETCEDVLLFDFDSLVPFEEINGKCILDKSVAVSFTTEYAPIELLDSSRREKICRATDIYEIGEVLFEKLTGRHSSAFEHSAIADYEYNRKAPMLENINPKVFSLLDDLFRHTICNDVKSRYQTANELVVQLDKIIELSNPKEPFLKSSFPNVSGFFTGRDAEIKEIHNRLQENNVLFLSGIGGIGKSELAKHYADKYKDEYDAIIFAPFVNDVQIMITSDEYVPIYNFHQYPEEKPDEYFERKMRKLGELCDERTLFIVDNLDEAEDKNIGRLWNLGCKMLVTTRMDFSDIYPDSQINIAELSNPFDIFNEHYKKPLTEEESKCVEEIIEIVCGHTMTVELLAKQMMAGRVKPEKMLEKLKNGGISESGKEKVRIAKDGDFSLHNTYEHIQALFDLSEIDEDEKYVLANLSLIPHTGISSTLFKEWCEIEDFDVINNLTVEGWIRWDKEKDYISLHPVLIGIFQHQICTRYAKPFISNFSKALVDDDTSEVILSVVKFSFANMVAKSIIKHIIGDKVELDNEAINCVLNIGLFFFAQDIFEWTEKAYYVAQKHYKRNNEHNAYLELSMLNNFALLYEEQGELFNEKDLLKKALSFLLKCLEIVEKPENNLNEHIGTIQGNIGAVYHSIEDYENAEKYYKLANATTDAFHFYNLLGVLYKDTMEYEKSLEMLQKAMEKADLNNASPLRIAIIEYNMATSYKKLGLLNDAATHCENALRINEKLLDPVTSYDLALTQSLLGQIYIETGVTERFSEAERLLSVALISLEKIVGSNHEEYQKARSVLNSFSKKD